MNALERGLPRPHARLARRRRTVLGGRGARDGRSLGPDPANSERVWQALLAFGAPVGELGVSRTDLETPGMVIQVGMPPRRNDLLTEASGLVFDEAWQNRAMHRMGSHEVPLLSRADLDVLERRKE